MTVAAARRKVAKSRPGVFLSYVREDAGLVDSLRKALQDRDLHVFMDQYSIRAGASFQDRIEQGIRESRGVAVVVSEESKPSSWMTYEFAFARGAEIPVMAVVPKGRKIPDPLRSFQAVQFRNASKAAKEIHECLVEESRSLARAAGAPPILMARFQERDGQVVRMGRGKSPSLGIDLWMEGVPSQTRFIAFEVLDESFVEPSWRISRPKSGRVQARPFLTDDFDSYGDVEIWARGTGTGVGSWDCRSRLFEALSRHYADQKTSADVRRCLRQIREN